MQRFPGITNLYSSMTITFVAMERHKINNELLKSVLTPVTVGRIAVRSCIVYDTKVSQGLEVCLLILSRLQNIVSKVKGRLGVIKVSED